MKTYPRWYIVYFLEDWYECFLSSLTKMSLLNENLGSPNLKFKEFVIYFYHIVLWMTRLICVSWSLHIQHSPFLVRHTHIKTNHKPPFPPPAYLSHSLASVINNDWQLSISGVKTSGTVPACKCTMKAKGRRGKRENERRRSGQGGHAVAAYRG